MPAAEHDVVIGHDDERDARVALAQRGHDRPGRGPLRQRTRRCLLDDRPVHHRVGERDADLDGVGPRSGDGRHHLTPVGTETAGDVGHEELAPSVARGAEGGLDLQDSSSRTWATSLSPLPERVMSTVDPGGSASLPAARTTHANACADSRAGMMPSVWLNSLKASRTSASVADTYVARPLAARYECSGPTPG